MIDTCEQYCTKVRHRLSKKDGKSTTETVRKTHENGKRHRSKERKSTDSQLTAKADETAEPRAEPKKRSLDKKEEEAKQTEHHISHGPECKRLKTDEKPEATDVTDLPEAVAELIVNDGKIKCTSLFDTIYRNSMKFNI